MKNSIISFFIVLLLSACASTATYEESQSRLAVCEEKQQRCATDLKFKEDELKSKLDDEIAAKNVQIARLEDRLTVRVLEKIFFNSGSTEILSRSEDVLKKIGSSLKGNSYLIRIEGHTDNVPIGSHLKSRFHSNWELACARAARTVRYLEQAVGIDPLRLEAVCFSKYRPIATNDTEENKQKNRRVEIIIKGKDIIGD